jgi:NitT/TauT family transport system permease protein
MTKAPASDRNLLKPPTRPEFERQPVDASGIGAVEKPIPPVARVFNNDTFRRALILVVLALVWEAYARWLNNPLLFPTFGDTVVTFWSDLVGGELLSRIATSIYVLLIGYAVGLAIAAIFTTVAVSSRIGTDLLSTLTGMFNPLPAIALLPLALLWFGLGIPSLVFVIVHSVLWAVALNTYTGFRAVPDTLRMTGQNYGLRGIRYVMLILIPAAFPAILAGLKIGWAFAWRTLIAAELVFGVASQSGGLGWYIFEARAELRTNAVFAGLLAVVLIGLFVESVVFRAIENRTVQKWGMQR